jgi:hypothetical protein
VSLQKVICTKLKGKKLVSILRGSSE